MNVRCICHVFLQNSIECSLFVDDEKHLSIKCIDIYLWKHVLDNISTDTQCAVSSYILFNRSEKWNLVKWSIIPSVIVCLFLDFELRVTQQETIRLEFNISETKLPPSNTFKIFCKIQTTECVIWFDLLLLHYRLCYFVRSYQLLVPATITNNFSSSKYFVSNYSFICYNVSVFHKRASYYNYNLFQLTWWILRLLGKIPSRFSKYIEFMCWKSDQRN